MELSIKTVIGDFAQHDICNTILRAPSLPMTDRFRQGQVSMTREAVWERPVADTSIRRSSHNTVHDRPQQLLCNADASGVRRWLFIDAYSHHSFIITIPRVIMPSVPSTGTFNSHTNFAFIFNAALESYRCKTKKELASHPLLPSLQHCDSPEAILSVLRRQIPTFNQSQNSDDQIPKWVIPTVKVLNAFSDTLGQVVGLVNISKLRCGGISTLIFTFQAFPPADIIFAGIGVLLSVSVLMVPWGSLSLTLRAPRRLTMPARVKTCSLMSSTASNVSFRGLTYTLALHRLQL
jgi:hypothetical protein